MPIIQRQVKIYQLQTQRNSHALSSASFLFVCSLFFTILFLLPAGSEAGIFSSEYKFNIAKRFSDQKAFEKCWAIDTNEAAISYIASDNTRNLLLLFEDGELVLINHKTGEKKWLSELGGKFVSEPVTNGNEIYIVSKITASVENVENVENSTEKQNRAFIRSINQDTGLTNWQTQIKLSKENIGKEKFSLYITDDFLVALDANGQIYWLNKADGQIARNISISNNLVSNPVIENNNLLLLSDGKLIQISLADGRIMPYTKLSDSGVSSLLLSGDRIYTGSEKGVLVSRGKTYGKQNWKIRLGAKISDITPAGRGILVSSLDNFIYFISKDNGKILWKRRFADRLLFKPVIVKDLILISPYSSTDVTFLDTNTGKIVNRVFLPEGNYITGNSIYINEYLYIQMLREVSAFSMEGCAAE